MAPKSRGASLLFEALIKPQASRPHICTSCRKSIIRQQVRLASTATAEASVEPPPITQLSSNEPGASPLAQPQITVKAGIVLSRAPLITPEPHPLETAYFLYQRRLNERVVLPFTQYFHFKRGTPAFEHWRAKRRERGGVAARDVGKYNAYTKESWNDEVLIGDDSGTPQKIVEQLVDEEGRASEFVNEADGEDSTKLSGLKRTTQADQDPSATSLERRLDRTLYLLVRDKGGKERSWRFPSGGVEGREGLKEAAQRVLDSSCGVNMSTWMVASHPIGHHVEKARTAAKAKTSEENPSDTETADTDKTFFMKARIMAGQADVKNSSWGLEEFKWLAKEEIEKHVTSHYWSSIKNMLVTQ